MKLAVAIPSGGKATAPFLESLSALDIPESVSALGHVTVTGNFVPAQRELLARRAIGMGADVMLMVDDDMVLPPHALTALAAVLESDDRIGIVGGLYYSRDGIRPMVVDGWSSSDTTQAWIPPFRSGDVIEAGGVGLGCALIRLDALRAMAPPIFATQVYIQQEAGHVRICNEDFLLCERMRSLTYAVKLHAGVRCGHYDRASGLTHPLAWENDADTVRRRMMVVEPGPRYSLVPYEPGASRVREQHENAPLEYIFVE